LGRCGAGFARTTSTSNLINSFGLRKSYKYLNLTFFSSFLVKSIILFVPLNQSMKLANLFCFNKEQRQILRLNYQILRQEVDKIGREYEKQSYEELLSKNEPTVLNVITAAGFKLTFVAEVYHLRKDGTICFCIDADVIKTQTRVLFRPLRGRNKTLGF